MITINQNRGFFLTFDNGFTISVQIGTNNYCDRREPLATYQSEMQNGNSIIQSVDAEIAIWNKDNVWLNFGSDEVKGYVSTDEVADWITKVSKATCLADLGHFIKEEKPEEEIYEPYSVD